MSDCIVEIVNSIPGIEELSFLELGTDRGVNFGNIKCKDKESVDINGYAMNMMTTKEFFIHNTRRFDIVFIDADHSWSAVKDDFNSSIQICDKHIFMHDMWPPHSEYVAPNMCGDSYRILHHMVNTLGIPVATLDTDSGLSFVSAPFKPIGDISTIYPCNYVEFLEAMRDFERYTLKGMKELLNDE